MDRVEKDITQDYAEQDAHSKGFKGTVWKQYKQGRPGWSYQSQGWTLAFRMIMD